MDLLTFIIRETLGISSRLGEMAGGNQLNMQNTATRNIGPVIRLLQINVEGISRAKSEYLGRLLIEENIDVVHVQETHAETSEDLLRRGKIPGYELLSSVDSKPHGIATYVRNGIRNASVLESYSADGLYWSSVRIDDVNFVNVYKSPSAQWPDEVVKVFPHPCMYAGDFNSHHIEWNYENNDENGENLSEWASTNSLCLVFDAKDRTTFFSQAHRKGSNPDLSFVSCDREGTPVQIDRRVLPMFPNSQHRPIVYSIGLSINVIRSIQRPRWNFLKARWVPFQRELDDVIRFVEPKYENYDRFVKLTINTAKKYIPRGFRKEYVPCWNEDSDRLYEELKNSYDPETAKELLRTLDDARRARWSKTMDDMSFTRSSRNAWSLLRRLGGASKANPQRPSINPNLVASRIVQSSKVRPDKEFTRRIRCKYSKLRRRTRRNGDLSSPFSVEEIDTALSFVKNGKAAGFDAIYPEFLTHSGPKVRKWLSLFFSDLLRRNIVPPIFKKAKIIALLKPGKPRERPESYRPISLLSVTLKLLERLIHQRISPTIEHLIPAEQAGFMKGRSCEDQVLSLTNHIEDGFQHRRKTGAVFIDLTAAYDTIWIKGLMFKLLKAVKCLRLCDFVCNMLSDRHFQVFLNDQSSTTRKLNNGLPQGSVLSCLLFNLYIHDLPKTKSRKFLYADDMAFTYQARKFQPIEKALNKDLVDVADYCRKWRLLPSPSKTVVTCFHLNHRDAGRALNVVLDGHQLTHDFEPKYLGITLDRTLTFKTHLTDTAAKLRVRNNLIQKLSHTSWGASASCLRTSALALVFSSAEYCCSVWINSAHATKVDVQLNSTLRMISGTVRSTPTLWLPALCDILPAEIRRKKALLREYQKIQSNERLPLHRDLQVPFVHRLKSRNPPLVLAKDLLNDNFDPNQSWTELWRDKGYFSPLFDINHQRGDEFKLQRRIWCNLNRLRTGHGRCNFMMHKWRLASSPNCICGDVPQTMNHILQECPILAFQTGSIDDILSLNTSAIDWLKALNL